MEPINFEEDKAKYAFHDTPCRHNNICPFKEYKECAECRSEIIAFNAQKALMEDQQKTCTNKWHDGFGNCKVDCKECWIEYRKHFGLGED